jgi:polynucleotide 5'-hydroxyl-kinase GRC3/NOL9
MIDTLVPPTDLPDEWQNLDLASLSGTIMVIGAPDAGKSTFSQYLFQCLAGLGKSVAFLDGDPGQSRLGPPTTMTIVCNIPGDWNFPPTGQRWRRFVGSTTPAAHMLPILVGAARLIKAVKLVGVQAVVYDTSGLIDPQLGGLALKLAKIDLLQPSVIFAIQHDHELLPLINPLRLSDRVRIIELRASSAVQTRSQAVRQAHRKAMFVRYFRDATLLQLNWMNIAVFPAPRFSLDRLVALEDSEGFVAELGLVKDIERQARQVTLLTPLTSFRSVVGINLGDIYLDPDTFQDRMIRS